MKEWYAGSTNPNDFTGSLDEGLQDADVFLGLAGPGDNVSMTFDVF